MGAGERQPVLLDGAELGRRLGADGADQVVGLLGEHLAGAGELGLALELAALDLAAHAELAIGAELELGLVGEALVPVLDQEVVVRQKGLTPLDHGVVEGLGQADGLEAHSFALPR